MQLSVAAPGLLKNDISGGKPLQVSAWTTPTLGTLTVDPSGSFIYNPPQNIASGTYVLFNYTATDGTTVTNQALVKIQVACSCHGAAPDVNVCPGTAISAAFLISKGAACNGCRDATPKFDLSKIPAQPVAGQCYPYTVTCPSCNAVTGQVCFRGPCTITSVPFTVCSSVTPTAAQIKDSGKVTCSCDTDPAISDPIRVGNHWEYTITCQSLCGSATATGTVNIDASCVPTIEFAFPIPTDNCQGHVLPTSEYIKENGGVSCGCGGTLVIPEEDIHWIEPTPPEANEWVGEYTAICRSANGCEASDVGQFTLAACEVDKCINVVCDDKNPCTDDSCDPAKGCVNTANTASCSDGNACTTGDVCADKVCTPGAAVSCEDNNVCTTDSCDSVKGCQNKDNTAKCDDGVAACTTGDVCSGGTCAGTPDDSKCCDGIACTEDVCNPSAGCVHTNEPTGTDCTYSGLCVDKATCQKGGSVAYCTPSSGAKNLCQDQGYPNNYKCCAASNTCTSNCGNACISHNQCTT